MTQYIDSVGIMLGLPLTGRPVRPEWALAHAQLVFGMNINLRKVSIFREEVGEARNWIAEQAISQGAEFLLFNDEDVLMQPHTPSQLLTRMRYNENCAVVCAVYPHKQHPCHGMVFRGNGSGPYMNWRAGEFFEISGCGMGATMIRTEVFKQLEKPWFKTVHDESKLPDGQNNILQYTEDLWFTDKLRGLINPKTGKNWELWADGSLLCEHWDISGKAYFFEPDSYVLKQIGIKQGTKKIVDLGCGESPYKTDEGEVVTVDAREEVNPDYRCDLRSLPFANEEFDIVTSSHVLEHFSRDEWGSVLDEWVRVLKKDGEFRLVVPNIEWAADQIKAGITEENRVHIWNVLYGAETYDLNFHKMGFTPGIIEKAFRDRGFKDITIDLPGYNIVCLAKRKEKRITLQIKKSTQKLLVAKKAAKKKKK